MIRPCFSRSRTLTPFFCTNILTHFRPSSSFWTLFSTVQLRTWTFRMSGLHVFTVENSCITSGVWVHERTWDKTQYQLQLSSTCDDLDCVQVFSFQSKFKCMLFPQMLMQLKNLALEAETELERQDEALDALTSSTDRATMNIERHTCRMKRLL